VEVIETSVDTMEAAAEDIIPVGALTINPFFPIASGKSRRGR
jgi:hypothetical protein